MSQTAILNVSLQDLTHKIVDKFEQMKMGDTMWLVITLGTVTIISVVALVHYVHFIVNRPEEFPRLTIGHKWSMPRSVYVSLAYIGAAVFGFSGFRSALFWIPESPEIQSSVGAIGALLAFMFALKLEKFAQLQISLKAFAIESTGMEKILNADSSELEKLEKEFRTKASGHEISANNAKNVECATASSQYQSAYSRLADLIHARKGAAKD